MNPWMILRTCTAVKNVPLPQYLLINVKRSANEDGVLNHTAVRINETVDVPSKIVQIGGKLKTDTWRYRHVASIYHHGELLQGGHYTSSVRRHEQNETIFFNDSTFTKVKLTEETSDEVTLVMYERMPRSSANSSPPVKANVLNQVSQQLPSSNFQPPPADSSLLDRVPHEVPSRKDRPTESPLADKKRDSPKKVNKHTKKEGSEMFPGESGSESEHHRQNHERGYAKTTGKGPRALSEEEEDSEQRNTEENKRSSFAGTGVRGGSGRITVKQVEPKSPKKRKRTSSDSGSQSSSDDDVLLAFPSKVPVQSSNARSEEESGDSCSEDGWKTKKGKIMKNRGKTLRLSKKPYVNYEFTIEITLQEWNCCIFESKDGKFYLRKAPWDDILLDAFEKTDPEHHTINWKLCGKPSVSGRRGMSIDSYAYCSESGCKEFCLAVEVTDLKCPPLIEVYSKNATNHPVGVQRTRILNRGRRRRAKKVLAKTTVSKYQDKQVKKLSDSAYLEGHLGPVKSDAVIQNVRSEVLAAEDLHTDDLFDVILRKRKDEDDEKPCFIQSVGEPFHAYLFSKNQASIILGQFKSWKFVTLFLDATGSLIRKPLRTSGRVYLYAGVVNVYGTLVPLLEMVSIRHGQEAIGSFLKAFRFMWTKDMKKMWPALGRVVTDCSFATIHAVTLEFNKMSLESYLRLCYKIVSSEYTDCDLGTIVLLQLCKNHWQKMMSTNLKNHSIRGSKKHLILEGIASISESKSLEDFVEKFTAFSILLLSKKIFKDTKEAVKTLVIGSRSQNDVVGVGPDPSEIEEEMFTAQDTLAASPFFSLCFSIVEQVLEYVETLEQSIDPSEEGALVDNPGYCRGFLKDVFLTRCAPIVPLWTQMMSNCRPGCTYDPPSNAHVEDYFNIEKGSTHVIKPNKLGRYIRIEREYIETKLIKVDKKLITNSRSYRKYCTTDSMNDAQKTKNTTTVGAEPLNEENAKVFSLSALDLGRRGERQEEPWRVDLFSKHVPYSECEKLKKTFLVNTDCQDSSRIDPQSGSPQKRSLGNVASPGPQGGKRKKLQIAAAETCIPTGELDDDKWNSPPKSLIASVQRPAVQREKNVSKTSTRKLLHNLFENPEKTAEDPSEDFSGVQVDVDVMLQKTYWGHYAVPPLRFFGNLKYVQKLEKSEREFVWNMCRGDPDRPLMLYGETDRFLPLSSFAELFDDKPLSNVTIDACLFCLQSLTDDTVCILSATEGNDIFQSAFTSSLSVNQRNIFDSRFVFIPFLSPGHWVLCLIDLKKLSFQLLDSAGEDTDKEAQYLGLWDTYVQGAYNKKLKWFTERRFSYPLQDDNVNCGVFLLKYVQHFSLKDEELQNIDCVTVRLEMARLCIEESQANMNESDLASTAKNLLCKRYENGLFMNAQYYKSIKKGSNEQDEFAVCVFGSGVSMLCSNDFDRLLDPCGWLTGITIDAAIHVNINEDLRKTYVNVSSRMSTNLIVHQTVRKEDIICNVVLSGKVLLMPINVNDNHWCLIVADISKKKYQFLDPSNSENVSQYFRNFQEFLEKRNNFSNDKISLKGWKVDKKNSFTTQQDGVSCGLFVIYYCLCILKASKKTKKFDPLTYRKVLAQELLQKTPTMKHLCPRCGGSEYMKTQITMVQCFHCHRWYHQNCDTHLKELSLQEIQGPSFLFKCSLCSRERNTAKKK